MSAQTPVKPRRGGNFLTFVGTSPTIINIGAGERSVRVVNASPGYIMFVCYSSKGTPQVASLAQTPVAPNYSIVIEKELDDDMVSIAALAGTANQVYVQPGEGGFL